MPTMSCDDVSNGEEFMMDLDELARRMGIKVKNGAADSAVKTPKAEEFSLRRGNFEIFIPVRSEGDSASIVRPKQRNPYSVNDCIEAGKTKPLNDMFSERTKPQPLPLGETDVQNQDPDALIDLYVERMKKRKR